MGGDPPRELLSLRIHARCSLVTAVGMEVAHIVTIVERQLQVSWYNLESSALVAGLEGVGVRQRGLHLDMDNATGLVAQRSLLALIPSQLKLVMPVHSQLFCARSWVWLRCHIYRSIILAPSSVWVQQ